MKKLAALLLLLPVLVSADPGSATRYLINEPASLFDIGILRLERDLHYMQNLMRDKYTDTTGNEDIMVRSSVRYDFADDKINITLGVVVDDVTGAEDGCRRVLRIGSLYVITSMDTAFSHPSYQKKEAPPEDILQELFNRTDVYCEVVGRESGHPVFKIRSNLSGNEVAVIKREN